MPETSVEKISIRQAIGVCLEKNSIFAAYRFPNSKSPEIVIQESNIPQYLPEGTDYSKIKGFLVAPFESNEQCRPFIISPDIYAHEQLDDVQLEKIQRYEKFPYQSNTSHQPSEISQEDYVTQVGNIVKEIQSGNFEKVVPSRVKLVNGNFVVQLPELFGRLCVEYPNAFVYIFNAGTHLWIGATPEPLLKEQNGSMHTVSLAGTRMFNERNLNIGAWNSKERLEQEYVTRYISKVLSKFNLIDIDLVGPYGKKAGNLVHLRTDFSFSSKELKGKLGEFLSQLHPTPAVCGMPRKESLHLIGELETHNREYYSGFIGPVGLRDRMAFFVNLRCMKVLQHTLALFVGGGITADSVPQDEWQETEIKAETLLRVIKQLYTDDKES